MQWERWCFTSRGGPATYVTVMLKGQASKLMGQKTKPLKKKKKSLGRPSSFCSHSLTYMQNRSHDRTANVKMRGGTASLLPEVALDFV